MRKRTEVIGWIVMAMALLAVVREARGQQSDDAKNYIACVVESTQEAKKGHEREYATACFKAKQNTKDQQEIAKYTLRLTVKTASLIQGSGCFMWLTDGSWDYYVEDWGMLHCHVLEVGTVLHAKLVHNGFSWEPLFYVAGFDEKGDMKVFRYKILRQEQ